MMKYNYMKIFSIGFILAACCLFYVPGNAQTTISADEVGTFKLYPTLYGDALGVGDTISGEIAVILNAEGNLASGCEELEDDYTDKIVVFGYAFEELDTCGSAAKVTNAMEAGAKAVIFILNTDYPTYFENVNKIPDIPAYVGLIKDFIPLINQSGSIENVDIYFHYDSSDKVIWGDEPGQGDFDGGFGEWTTKGITSDTALWVYAPNSVSAGMLRHFIIDSPTRGNGAALMDNDAYLTADGEIPDQPYGDVGSELISPIIDISDEGPVSIKWYQYCIPLNTAAATPIGLYYSTDGGENWSARINVTTDNVLSSDEAEPFNPEIKTVPVPGATGASQFRFKIEFRSDFYAMLVDDVQIVETAATDLAIGDIWYGPATYMQPAFTAEYDALRIYMDVINEGSTAQENIGIRVEVIDESNEEVVKSLESVFEGLVIPPGESIDPELPETLSLEGIGPGSYRVEYTILAENDDDAIPENNKGSYRFRISENTFGTSELTLTNLSNNRDDAMVGLGNVYSIPAEVVENYKVGSVETTYYYNIDKFPGGAGFDPTGQSLQILISSIPDDAPADLGDYGLNNDADPVNQDLLISLALQQIDLTGTSPEQIVSADGGSFNDAEEFTPIESVPLENGKRYVFWNLMESSDLALPINGQNPIPFRSWSPIIYSRDDAGNPTYYGGYLGGYQGILHVNLQLISTTDDAPLPAEAMTVYPNPVASATLFTDLSFNAPTNATITIADMNGMVQSYEVYKNVVNQTIENDISNLPAGMYLIRLATKDGSKTTKFIKQ